MIDFLYHHKEKRPLYNAIKKYGVEHFKIEEIEECDESIAAEREIYWIEYYNSYKNGYNATLGGDGKSYLNYKKILLYYDSSKMCATQIAQECNCSVDSVYSIIEQYRENVDWKIRSLYAQSKRVLCVENNMEFPSIEAAGRWLSEKTGLSHTCSMHIRAVAYGKRKTCGGYHWRFLNN